MSWRPQAFCGSAPTQKAAVSCFFRFNAPAKFFLKWPGRSDSIRAFSQAGSVPDTATEMSRRSTVLNSIGVAVLALLLSGDALAQGKPRIKFEWMTYDFGHRAAGPTYSTNFKFQNVGTAPLVVHDVQTACGCTVGKPPGREIPPQGTGELPVTFDSRGRSGLQSGSIVVVTNDPEQPEVRLTFTIHLSTEVKLNEDDLQFHVQRGQPADRGLHIEYSGTGNFQVTKVESSAPFITSRVEKIPDWDKKGCVIVVRIEPNAPVGVFREKVRIYTSIPSLLPVEVPVLGKVVEDVEVIPSVVRLVGLSPRNISVKRSGQDRLKVVKAECDLKCVAVEVQEVEPGKQYRVFVKLVAVPSSGQTQGKISIHTDDPQVPVLTASVYVSAVGSQGR